ncbi:MAG TPA: TlpA disulfide reductase family protein [Gemmatimonadales bacterium]|nr:TlpA disulfide reductase family protein [Gemmatimonadales bacterium]
MRAGARGLGVLLGVALLGAGPAGAQEPGVGDSAPIVAVHDLDGASVDLGQWIGRKPVFLEFWATWCTSCAALDPAVRAARARYGSAVEFIGINITVGDARDTVRAWVTDHAPPWRVLYDDEGVSQRAYDVAATSYVVIIDRSGRIAYTGVGGTQSFDAALRRVASP